MWAPLRQFAIASSLSLVALAFACAGEGTSSPGTGGGGGSGGGVSPGKASLELEVPASKSYCRTVDDCGSAPLITILDSSGQALVQNVGWCPTMCSDCTPQPCPGAACFPHGEAIQGVKVEWDGSYYASGTCGADVQCVSPAFAAAGKYTAKVCATPGTLEQPDGSFEPQCVTSGPAECVEVSFDFPSSTPIKLALPG